MLGNAFGTRLAEEPLLAPALADAARLLIGDQLQLRPLDPTEALATTPVYAGARTDSLVPGEVVVRLHAAVVGDQVHVMQGGVGRVLAPGDHPSAPSARLVKDVWVVGGPASTRTTPRVVSHPQVDFGASVPRRAADALYWMGRAAERAEVGARTVRVLAAQVQQDPSLIALGGGGWSSGALALLRAAQALPLSGYDALVAVPLVERVQHELRAANLTVATQIGTVVQEATSVREFLSTTTGRVLGRLTRLRADLLSAETAADDLDIVLVDLAALAGLSMESTVRGPAWRFLDMGRRLSRARGKDRSNRPPR